MKLPSAVGITIMALLLLSACSNSNIPPQQQATTEIQDTRSPEQKSQDKFCNFVEKGIASYKSEGMSYTTRDIYGKAYDVVHEELLGVYGGSRYSDYNDVMSSLSFAFQDENWNAKDIAAAADILNWCSNR